MRLGVSALEALLKLGIEREEISKVSDYRKGADGKKGVGYRVVFEI